MSFKLITAYLLIPILAIVGAWLNIYARNVENHISTVLLFIMSLLVTVPWVIIVKYSLTSLSVAGAVFDALYGISYFLAFVVLGEAATNIQWIGAGITIIGIIMMSL